MSDATAVFLRATMQSMYEINGTTFAHAILTQLSWLQRYDRNFMAIMKIGVVYKNSLP